MNLGPESMVRFETKIFFENKLLLGWDLGDVVCQKSFMCDFFALHKMGTICVFQKVKVHLDHCKATELIKHDKF